MQATIHNEFLTLTVDTHGAEAVSLKNAAGEEMLWQADPAIWKRHAPILFPWTGKLVDGTFAAKGKTWKGGQHGFARDLEHTLLRAEVYGSGSKADTPCDKCKAAHPECDKCCKTCDDHCNAFQLCRKEYGE